MTGHHSIVGIRWESEKDWSSCLNESDKKNILYSLLWECTKTCFLLLNLKQQRMRTWTITCLAIIESSSSVILVTRDQHLRPRPLVSRHLLRHRYRVSHHDLHHPADRRVSPPANLGASSAEAPPVHPSMSLFTDGAYLLIPLGFRMLRLPWRPRTDAVAVLGAYVTGLHEAATLRPHANASHGPVI